jgi:hypothetical protein
MPISTQVLGKYKNDIFIETGTLLGDGVARALECDFKDIYSVEIRDDNFAKSCERFKDNNRVHLFKGDSMVVLPQILLLVNNNSATFWLDAHVNGKRDKVLGEKSNPILDEIDIIMRNHHGNKIIMIDDMRLFSGEGRSMWKNIKHQDILNTFKKYGNYKIVYENGGRRQDIMVVEII